MACASMKRKDTQIVELAGRNRLASELQKANIEVARPERDHGVDLLAYLDLEKKFFACPIQMKAATGEIFDIQRRYAKFPELILVYVWNVEMDKSRYFALTYNDAENVAKEMRWTETHSWKVLGGYGVWNVNDELLRKLAPHEITEPQQWRKKLFPKVLPITLANLTANTSTKTG
jgi:hypothetical protein